MGTYFRSDAYYHDKWTRIEAQIAYERSRLPVHCSQCNLPVSEGRPWHARQDELQRRGFAAFR